MTIDESYTAYFAKTNDAVASAILTLAEIVQISAVGKPETLQNIVQAAMTNPTGFGR